MQTVYDAARKDLGTWEWKDGHNPKVLKYFADVGHDWVKEDEVAWCSAFVGAKLKEAGLPHTGKLNARSYLDWGQSVEIGAAKPGDVVVLWRGSPESWKGHVGFFVRYEGEDVILLGGNQNNQVNEQAYPADRILGVRRMRERKSPSQSNTMKASATISAAGAGSAVSAVAALDDIAQYIVLGFAGVIVLAALFIMRERLKAWANGYR